MDHKYAKKKLTELIRDVDHYSADEFRRQMARIISGATGQKVHDDCHLLTRKNTELSDSLAIQLRKHRKLQVRYNVLLAVAKRFLKLGFNTADVALRKGEPDGQDAQGTE